MTPKAILCLEWYANPSTWEDHSRYWEPGPKSFIERDQGEYARKIIREFQTAEIELESRALCHV